MTYYAPDDQKEKAALAEAIPAVTPENVGQQPVYQQPMAQQQPMTQQPIYPQQMAQQPVYQQPAGYYGQPQNLYAPQPVYQPPPPPPMIVSQPVYQPPPPQNPGIVVIGGNGVASNKRHPNVFGCTSPISIDCPHCDTKSVTKTSSEISQQQWLACVVLCVFGCPCPCIVCYIPS